MPVKTKNAHHKKYPQHYAKVYWPYIPLVLLILAGLWIGKPMVDKSQRGVLAYATDVNNTSLFEDTNNARVAAHKSTLRQNLQLTRAANAKAEDMAKRDYWSHVTPTGEAPWVFIDKAGYSYQKAGENLAYGFTSSDEVITGWLNSPEHKANLLDGDFTEVGFGIASSPNYQNQGPETIVVAIYGEPGQKSSGTYNTDDSGLLGFNTQNNTSREASANVSIIQSISGGKAPWLTFAIGIMGGVALAFVLGRNSLHMHRRMRNGEKFVITHPIFDITLLVFVALCALLVQSAGFIR